MGIHNEPGSCLSATLLSFIVAFCFLAPSFAESDHVSVSLNFLSGFTNLGIFNDGINNTSDASNQRSNGRNNDSIVLAASRTKRPDVLRKFRKYEGGWNISDHHYWSSVAFTGAAGFILAAVWLCASIVTLTACHCFRGRINSFRKGAIWVQRVYLLLLILFTCAATTGCIFLAVGQNEFHGESLSTLKYVVNQSDYTVQTLRNVTEYLGLAKTIKIAQLFLPTEAMNQTDKLRVELNVVADTVSEKTQQNSAKFLKVFHAVRTALISLASVMLFLTIFGLIFSILGQKHALFIFALTGWLLVVITFILCGIFLVLGNAISDTCLAMKEYVDNPQASSALSSILPCVDKATTNKTLIQSKKIINDMINIVNTYIYTFANTKASQRDFGYYNQSGPLMPPLCHPFDPQLQDKQCGAQEVSLQNASLVWGDYVCEVSSSGMCSTAGRITPEIYRELVVAVNESYALQYYAPLLLNLQDCKFVQDTFNVITSAFCPLLKHDLKFVNVGLGLISAGVSLCLLLWISNRPRREEVFEDKRLAAIDANQTSLEAGEAINGLVWREKE